MIIAKLANQSEFNTMKKFLIKNNLIDLFEEDSLIYILKENEQIVGITQAKLTAEYAILDYIFIEASSRGNYYGDGLLRSILNYLYANNINEVYYLNNNEFLLKEGFEKTSKDKIKFLSDIYNTNDILYLNLTNFFSLGCKSSRR